MPDAGLPTTTNISLRPDSPDDQNPSLTKAKHIEFIEFPGRFELLKDFLENIKPDASRKKTLILFFISFYRLDEKIINDDGEVEFEFDHTLKTLELLPDETKDIPVLIQYTMLDETQLKWKYYTEQGLLEEKLKLLNIYDEVNGAETFNIECVTFVCC